jgi:outer membrane biosynthesis protein TonB
MERSERIGLGVAIAGHAALFGLFSLSLFATPKAVPKPPPIDVSLVDEVGLQAQAPQTVTPPAESKAPDQGPQEDAPPPAKQEAKAEPTPPAPEPEPAPPPKPAPKAPPEPKKKPAPPAPEKKAKTPPKQETAKAGKADAKKQSTGSDVAATKPRPRSSRLGDDFLKGIGDKPSKTKSVVPQAAVMNAQAAADIGSAIVRQVQPCANRQVKPGPGAERIRVTIRLRLNRDGSLADNPQVIGHDGVDAENNRYQDRVDDNAIATFKGCSPLRGLPAELYDVPNGWSNFILRYKLPG